MLSRVANNIYWMARYIERAENTARLINVNTHLVLDMPRKVHMGWEPLVEMTSGSNAFHEHFEEADERSVIRFLVTDRNNPGSIMSSLEMARANGRTIRDIIPTEAWERVNALCLEAKNGSQQALGRRNRYGFLSSVILGSQTITGLLSGTMPHDEGYSFLRLGRNLERADMTTRIIDVRSATLLPDASEELSTFDNLQWIAVLKSLTAYQAYRRQVRLRIRREDVLKYLLHSTQFPRAFRHSIDEVERCLEELPRNDQPMQRVTDLQTTLASAQPDKLKQAKLHDFIDHLQLGLMGIHSAVSETYF